MNIILKKKRKKRKNLIINVILISFIIICLIIILCQFCGNRKKLIPDYAPGVIDSNAIKENDNDDKMNISNGGGAVNLIYSDTATIDLETKNIQIYFKNPSKSRESIILQIIIRDGSEEVVIAESDLIPSGYSIKKMLLNDNISLSKGGYEGIFKVVYYNEETRIKEMVDTKIDISMEVK